MPQDTLYDVAIIGGGPAGLSAGVWLARYLHSVVLVDSGDPRNWETRAVNGFLGRPRILPSELRAHGRDECRTYGVELIDGCVARAAKQSGERFALELEDGRTFAGRRLLLAFGIRDVWPAIPGLEPAYGETAHVCPDCDGYESRGAHIAVIGTGRKAVGMALSLATWSDTIVICTNGLDPDMPDALRGKLRDNNIRVFAGKIARLHQLQGDVQALHFDDGTSIACDRVFFNISQYPADDLGARLGCERDEHGQIVVDEKYHTSVSNVYAAGDIIPGPQLAIAAAADGAIAALAIHKSLLPAAHTLE